MADGCERAERGRCYGVVLVGDVGERGCGELGYVTVDFGDMGSSWLDRDCKCNYVTITKRSLLENTVFK